VTADGDVVITADDSAGIHSNVKLVASSTTTNDGGASLLDGAFRPARRARFHLGRWQRRHRIRRRGALDDDYAVATYDTTPVFPGTTNVQDVAFGDVVEVTEDATGDGTVGGLYKYVGTGAQDVDLVAVNYGSSADWVEIAATRARCTSTWGLR